MGVRRVGRLLRFGKPAVLWVPFAMTLACGKTSLDESYESIPDELEPFTALALGFIHSCGLLQGGGVVCWGDQSYGQRDIESLHGFVQLVAGRNFTCGLRAGGGTLCTGNTEDGQ